MKKVPFILFAGATLSALPAYAAVSVELRGSPASMVQQNQVARTEGYSFVQTATQVEKMVDKKYLVKVHARYPDQCAPRGAPRACEIFRPASAAHGWAA